jgi:HK97 family phage major capsid protein
MDEDTAAFVAEGVTAADASMNFKDLILAPRRVTHYQSISKELLSNVSPAIYASILQNLRNGIWNAVTNDVFDTLDSDAGNDRTTARAALGGSVTFTDIVNMEASINALNIGAGAYVTTPLVKGYLKKTAALTNQAAIWSDGEVNGYPAYAAPAVNAEHLVFGDFSRQVVGTWGPLEIILDPFTGAKTGTVTIVASMLADSGCANPKAFVILSDTSTN